MAISDKTAAHVASAFKVSPGWVAGIIGVAAAIYLATTVITHEEGQGGAVAVAMTQLTGTVERSIEAHDERFEQWIEVAKAHWDRSERLHEHQLAVLRASCINSANGSVESRDRCLEVGRFGAD